MDDVIEYEVAMIGEAIRSRREALGWSQETLSRKAGIRPAYLSRIETGRIKEARMSTIARIARAMQCDFGDLVSAYDYQTEEVTTCR